MGDVNGLPGTAPILPNPASMKSLLSSKSDKPLLQATSADDPAIDYIGRWDHTKTARWAGSSLRFAFTGALLFLVPGERTFSTDFPTLGWTVDGVSYTARARPGVSVRLWPPEGQQQQPHSPSPSRPSTSSGPKTATLASFPSETPSPPRIVEVSLIDWGSVLQVGKIQSIEPITPAYPQGIGNLPSLLFIGDSITSGFIRSPQLLDSDDSYSGFLDAYPAHLHNLISDGARVSAIAFPGIRLVDEPDGGREGMESQWFKAGPMENSQDWNFEDRDGESGPTHIFVNLGQNDYVRPEVFVETYKGFLNMLKETHGRRTGDIFVIDPFGSRKREGEAYTNRYPQVEEMVKALSQQWEEEDPFAEGDFPSTPLFELTKLQLDSPDPALSNIPRMLAQQLSPRSSRMSANSSVSSAIDGLPSPVTSPRPSLIVRPSSIAAISPSARGTRARLHFIPTRGWLDDDSDTFDGVHPTRSGAVKIAQKLRAWLMDGGFLVDMQ